MSAEIDNFSYDNDVFEDIEDIITPRVQYWIGNCQNQFIPDHIRWVYKKRLYLVSLILAELQAECESALNKSQECSAERAWLADWAIERALNKLQN